MSLADKRASQALLAGLAAVGSLALAGTALAQGVVVRSTGPSAATYPQGKKLPANASVVLKKGDQVTVLDKSGTRVLAGPGNYTLDGKVERAASTGSIAGALTGGPRVRTRTGAVRGAGGAADADTAMAQGPDSVWYVDVSKGGTYCIADPAQVVLWRPNRSQEATGKLTAAAGAKTVEVTWKKGNPLKLWPAESLPVENGSTYTFADPVGPTVSITTKLLGALPEDEVAVAGMLADHGCKAQLDVLANAATPAEAVGG